MCSVGKLTRMNCMDYVIRSLQQYFPLQNVAIYVNVTFSYSDID